MLKSLLIFSITSIVTSILLDYDIITKYLPSYEKSHKNYLFTPEELAKYNGNDRKELYLSILGNVFDVSKGAKFYGPGETYHTFVGRDNSRSFVTGSLGEKDASDQVIPLSHQEFRSLNNWHKFYKKEYPKVGKLIGRFYNKNGKQTAYLKEVKLLLKAAEEAQANEELEKIKFPPCNVEWDPKIGTKFWCTNKSGGIQRNWAGVPRQLYEVGAESHRCACIHDGNEKLGNIKEYEGCDPDSDTCYVKT